MTRLRWVLPAAALLALDLYLLVWRTSEVLGNCEAQVIIVTPAFVISHVLHRRDAARHHREQVGRAEAHAAKLAAVTRKVGELHDWHLRGILPPDVLKP